MPTLSKNKKSWETRNRIMRKKRRLMRSEETPEEKIERRERDRIYAAQRRAMAQSLELPEERKARKRRERLRALTRSKALNICKQSNTRQKKPAAHRETDILEKPNIIKEVSSVIEDILRQICSDINYPYTLSGIQFPYSSQKIFTHVQGSTKTKAVFSSLHTCGRKPIQASKTVTKEVSGLVQDLLNQICSNINYPYTSPIQCPYPLRKFFAPVQSSNKTKAVSPSLYVCSVEPINISKTVPKLSTKLKETVPSLFVPNLSRRKIIDVDYFLRMLKVINMHNKPKCDLNDVDIVTERKAGLRTSFHLQCAKCKYKMTVQSESGNIESKNINADIVKGFLNINCGLEKMNQLLTEIGLAPLSCQIFNREFAKFTTKLNAEKKSQITDQHKSRYIPCIYDKISKKVIKLFDEEHQVSVQQKSRVSTVNVKTLKMPEQEPQVITQQDNRLNNIPLKETPVKKFNSFLGKTIQQDQVTNGNNFIHTKIYAKKPPLLKYMPVTGRTPHQEPPVINQQNFRFPCIFANESPMPQQKSQVTNQQHYTFPNIYLEKTPFQKFNPILRNTLQQDPQVLNQHDYRFTNIYAKTTQLQNNISEKTSQQEPQVSNQQNNRFPYMFANETAVQIFNSALEQTPQQQPVLTNQTDYRFPYIFPKKVPVNSISPSQQQPYNTNQKQHFPHTVNIYVKSSKVLEKVPQQETNQQECNFTEISAKEPSLQKFKSVSVQNKSFPNVGDRLLVEDDFEIGEEKDDTEYDHQSLAVLPQKACIVTKDVMIAVPEQVKLDIIKQEVHSDVDDEILDESESTKMESVGRENDIFQCKVKTEIIDDVNAKATTMSPINQMETVKKQSNVFQ